MTKPSLKRRRTYARADTKALRFSDPLHPRVLRLVEKQNRRNARRAARQSPTPSSPRPPVSHRNSPSMADFPLHKYGISLHHLQDSPTATTTASAPLPHPVVDFYLQHRISTLPPFTAFAYPSSFAVFLAGNSPPCAARFTSQEPELFAYKFLAFPHPTPQRWNLVIFDLPRGRLHLVGLASRHAFLVSLFDYLAAEAALRGILDFDPASLEPLTTSPPADTDSGPFACDFAAHCFQDIPSATPFDTALCRRRLLHEITSDTVIPL